MRARTNVQALEQKWEPECKTTARLSQVEKKKKKHTSSVALDILSWFWPTSTRLSSPSHIHVSLPSGSVNPFCTPLFHFPWPPPSHLLNGRIVLMDCPKQQRGWRFCHYIFTPPLHSSSPYFCLNKTWKHALFFAFFCLVTQATFLVRRETLWLEIDQVAKVSWST